MNRETKAVSQMNAAAGLPGGYDEKCRHRGISVGYIGNVERGRDDRSWGFFRPHPDAGDRMLGNFPTCDALLDDFYARRGHYLNWAEGAQK